MAFMALVFNVLLHCLNCIVYTMMIVMLHTTDQPTTENHRRKKNEKPKHFDTIPNEPLIILIGR